MLHAKLEKMLSNGQTSSEQQLPKFRDKAKRVYEELGPWAADYFFRARLAAVKTLSPATCHFL